MNTSTIHTENLATLKDIRSFAKISSFIPTIWFVSFSLILLTGVLRLGHLPIYFIDKNIDNTFIGILNIISSLAFIISFIAVPAWILLIIHLLINKVRFTKLEIIFHSLTICSIILFLLFKFVWISQFLWVND